MNPSEFEEINQWCIDEGWNIGLYDSETYYKVDPLGHFVAKTSKAIASLSLVKHSPTFFTLGPFIVHKSYRGQGIGEKLWNVAMTRMNYEHPDSLIVLYAVSKQVERYKRAGFMPVLKNQRWYINSKSSILPSINYHSVSLTKDLITTVSQYYKNHYFTDRELLFTNILKKPETNGLVIIDDNLIKGFGFIRRCVRGFRIGSLVADTPEIAQVLISDLLDFSLQEPVFIDVPDSNPHEVSYLNVFNAARAPQEDTITMIKGTGYSKYLKQWEQHYGLFSLEIG